LGILNPLIFLGSLRRRGIAVLLTG